MELSKKNTEFFAFAEYMIHEVLIKDVLSIIDHPQRWTKEFCLWKLKQPTKRFNFTEFEPGDSIFFFDDTEIYDPTELFIHNEKVCLTYSSGEIVRHKCLGEWYVKSDDLAKAMNE